MVPKIRLVFAKVAILFIFYLEMKFDNKKAGLSWKWTFWLKVNPDLDQENWEIESIFTYH